jgi:hypothetical protein
MNESSKEMCSQSFACSNNFQVKLVRIPSADVLRRPKPNGIEQNSRIILGISGSDLKKFGMSVLIRHPRSMANRTCLIELTAWFGRRIESIESKCEGKSFNLVKGHAITLELFTLLSFN